jgi:prepilin-type N-terminal cleavage/methylation domain-containing protein
MRLLRQSNPSLSARAAFTLIELIFVMAILAIGAAFVAPNMTSFFHGRVLSSEARRMLSLIHYGQSRAIAEGVPVLLWLNTRDATYGLSIQSGYVEADDRASSFTLEPGLTMETPLTDPAPVSELGDETFGVPSGLAVIRFLPNGFFDEISTPKIVIHQGSEGALELIPTANRLSYEILPVAPG